LTAAIRAWVNYCNWLLERSGAKQSLANTCFQCVLSKRALHCSPSLFSPSHCGASASEVVNEPTGDGCQRERDVRSILISLPLLLHPITYTKKHNTSPLKSTHFASVRIQYHRLYPQFLFRERPRVFISRRVSTIKTNSLIRPRVQLRV
jgi:hypothetical protein